MTGLPSGTVTFLFTDLEESTRLWDEHPDAMRDALARHDAILRTGIEEHSGAVVKSTGDGVYAAFGAAPDAVAAAANTMRALTAEQWGDTGPLRARMALHTGIADERDNDYFGPALNRASRLMSAAHGGQIVLSQASAELVKGMLAEELSLEDLGDHRFRGLAQPERVFELVIEGMPSEFPPLQSLDATPGTLELPEPAFAPSGEALAGREAEYKRLRDTWKTAVSGVRQIALVGGEPGIGKTRLVDELSRRAHSQGGVVLYGRCDEETIVPYQPFVEALRLCVAEYTPAALRQRLHGLELDLARVFPELTVRVGAAPAPSSADPEADRYRLFEAITSLITGIAAAQPVMLVLDDLQWADLPTLLLLRHLVRSSPRNALLVVVCFRDVELAADHPVSDFLADLRREPGVLRMSLIGISADSTGDLLRAIAGHDLPAGLVTALHAETAGNPFFLEELVRHLMETGALARIDAGAVDIDLAPLGLPDSVREVVSRRVRRLAAPVNEVLTVAAVIGQEFDADLLGRAAEKPAAEVLESLDQAAHAGLVRQDETRMGRYRFTHALIRQTLTASLSTARLAQLHAAVGAAMESGAGPRSASDLARHFTYAAPLVGVERAIQYTVQAGREALDNVAFEAAVAKFTDALELLDQYSPESDGLRVELLTDRASALVYVDERAGVDAALRAVEAARAEGSPAHFGRAVAVFVEPMHAVAAYPAEVTALFDEARVVLGGNEAALRARLLAFEAFKYAVYQLTGRDGRALAAEALRIARTLDDPLTLSDALFALATSLEGEAEVEQRVELGNELVRLGPAVGARASAFGLRVLAGTYLETGEADGVTASITRLERVGAEARWLPALVYAAQWKGTQALLEGRFDDARARGEELQRYTRAYRAASSMHIVQTFQLAREEGALSNMAPLEETAAEHTQSLLTWGMLALAQLESGQEDLAFSTLARVEAAGFSRTQTEGVSGAALGMLAEVAAAGGAVGPAETLYELLTPFQGRLLSMVLGLACLGAADRYLGMLSTTLGRFDEADAHFARAEALEAQVRGAALLPRTRYWRARLLQKRGDRDSARALLGDVVTESQRLGMRGLAAQAETLLAV
jgi:class 3 adenylate cyclase/tetratricopeptide (TPR) repeat protein